MICAFILYLFIKYQVMVVKTISIGTSHGEGYLVFHKINTSNPVHIAYLGTKMICEAEFPLLKV